MKPYKLIQNTIVSILFIVSLINNAWADEPVINKKDVLILAANYVKLNQGKRTHSFSKSVSEYQITDITDWQGHLKAYEVALFDSNKKPKGYINIPVEKGHPVVSSFFYDGAANSDSLEYGLSKALKKLNAKGQSIIVQKRLFGTPNGAMGIFFTTNKALTNLEHHRNITAFKNGYIFAYMPFYMVKNELISSNRLAVDSFLFKTRSASNDIQKQFEQEVDEFRKQLLDGTATKPKTIESAVVLDIADEQFSTRSSGGTTTGGVNSTGSSGYTQFSFYDQESNFDGSGCFAGCTPVAFAILLEYWDRHGYPNMVGSASQNNFRNHTNSTVRSMIRRLRNDMGTYCTSQGNGATAISNNPQATGYISSRGYSHWGIFNSTIGNQSANAWNLLKQELNQNRPVVSIISSEGSEKNLDHSVVAYSYEDLPGVSNDKSCFILGWGRYAFLDRTINQRVPYMCQSRTYHFGTTAVIPDFWSSFPPWWHY